MQTPRRSCTACGTPLDDATRRTTLSRMGPWFVRLESLPFMPGCSWSQLAELVERGVIHAGSVVRGPTTRQLWTLAERTPGVAHLVGRCHACGSAAARDDACCRVCRASFGAPLDRDSLGIVPPDEPSASTHAFNDGDEPRLSSFATNSELREGIHEEVRRRRSLGASAVAGERDRPGGASTALGTLDAASVRDVAAQRRRWTAIAFVSLCGALLLATIAVLVTTIVGTTRAVGARPPATDAPVVSADASWPAPGGIPRAIDAWHDAGRVRSSDPRSESAPAAAREGDGGSLDGPATDSASGPRTPVAAEPSSPTAPALEELLAKTEALLREVRDSTIDRQRRLDEAASMLDSTRPLAAGDAEGLRRIEALAARIDEERRRIASERFLRGDRRR